MSSSHLHSLPPPPLSLSLPLSFLPCGRIDPAAAATAPAAGDDGAPRTQGVRRRRRLPHADGGGSGSPRTQRQWRRRLVREA
uniref:Uncharacterized protein n=1 Tax=Oryza rufipogon TaxID=4529 RepID=A0A0E0PVZ7_ORYRU